MEKIIPKQQQKLCIQGQHTYKTGFPDRSVTSYEQLPVCQLRVELPACLLQPQEAGLR